MAASSFAALVASISPTASAMAHAGFRRAAAAPDREFHGESADDVVYAGNAPSSAKTPVASAGVGSDAYLISMIGLTWLSKRGIRRRGRELAARARRPRNFGSFETKLATRSDPSSASAITRACVRSAATAATATTPAGSAQNRPPTVKARCEPCTVEVGRTTVRATHRIRWRYPELAGRRRPERSRVRRIARRRGPPRCRKARSDGSACPMGRAARPRCGHHSGHSPAVKEFVFEDVHFDFDRYCWGLKRRALDEAVKSLQQNPELRIQVEGHTCNIGYGRVQLALGTPRCRARLPSSRGIGADRLQTVTTARSVQRMTTAAKNAPAESPQRCESQR